MKELVFAGFGGQGVLTAGLILAYTALEHDRNVSWIPSFGAEVRGGKANCTVKLAEDETEIIGNPTMNEVDILVAMNEPSLSYISACKEDATVFVNSSAMSENVHLPEGVKTVRIPCTELARQCGSVQCQSIIMVAAVISRFGLFDRDSAKAAMLKMFEEKGKSRMAELNSRAFDLGFDFEE